MAEAYLARLASLGWRPAAWPLKKQSVLAEKYSAAAAKK